MSPFHPLRGGIAQFADEWSKPLSQVCNLHPITYQKLYPDFLFPGTDQFVENAERKHSDWAVPGHQPWLWAYTARKIVSYCKANKVQTIIIAYWMPYFLPLFWILTRRLNRRGIQVFLLTHNLISHDAVGPQSTLVKKFLSKVDKVITLSDRVAENVRLLAPNSEVLPLKHPIYQHFGEKLNKQDARNKLRIDAEKKLLLFFGLIRPYKGLKDLLECMQFLSADYELLIAGECYESKSEYHYWIQKIGKNRVHWHDRYIPDNEVNVFFSAADTLVLPYREATQSGVFAIAAHFQLPVVASNVGGLSEFIQPSKNGLLVEPGNRDALKDGLMKSTSPAFSHETMLYYRENPTYSFLQLAEDVIRGI